MTLILVNHGGKCCGIKVIYGFYSMKPNSKIGPIEAAEKPNNDDQLGLEVSSDQSFFTGAAPAETAEERLDRYIDFVKTRRPRHVIEVVLALSNHSSLDQSVWFPVLEKKGFVCVTTAKNSNSGNVIHIFHLKVGQDS